MNISVEKNVQKFLSVDIHVKGIAMRVRMVDYTYPVKKSVHVHLFVDMLAVIFVGTPVPRVPKDAKEDVCIKETAVVIYVKICVTHVKKCQIGFAMMNVKMNFVVVKSVIKTTSGPLAINDARNR